MRFLSIYMSRNVRARKWKEVTSIHERRNRKGTGSSPWWSREKWLGKHNFAPKRGHLFWNLRRDGKVCVHTDKMKWSWKGEAGKIQQSNTKFSKFNELWDLNFHYIWDTLSSIQNQSPLFLLLCCEVNALSDPWPFQVTHATVNVGLCSCIHTQSYLFYLLIDICFPRNYADATAKKALEFSCNWKKSTPVCIS